MGLYLWVWILFFCANWFYELLQCILVLRASDLSLTLARLDMDLIATLPIAITECHKPKCSQWNTQRELHRFRWLNKGTWRQAKCDTLWGEWNMPNCNVLSSIFETKQMNNRDVAILTMVDENTNIYPPTFVAISSSTVELVMRPKHQEQATEPKSNICPNVRLSLQEIYPNMMFFKDSCRRSKLKLCATLAIHAKNLVKSTLTFGLNDQKHNWNVHSLLGNI